MKTAEILDFMQELNDPEYNLTISRGDRSIDVKGTEVNSVNSLKIKHFRVFGQPSEGCLDTRIFLLRKYVNRHF